MSLAVAEDAEEVGDEEGAEHEDGREQRRVRLGQVLLEGNPTTFRMCNRMYHLQHVLVFVKLKLVALHYLCPCSSEAMVAVCSADWKSSPFPQDSLREASESKTVALQTPAWGGIHV